VQLSCAWAPAGLRYPIGTASSAFVRAKVAATRALLGGAARFPLYDNVQAAQAAMFADFWGSGSFVELAAKGAPDALELERRAVLSRYLTRVNSAGASPPQETGLISNSWAGKFHLEMRFWHHAHWPVWGNSELMARSWGFYFDLLPNATSLAAYQGYEGARWMKMLGLANPLLNGVGGARAIDVAWLGTDSPPAAFPSSSHAACPASMLAPRARRRQAPRQGRSKCRPLRWSRVHEKRVRTRLMCKSLPGARMERMWLMLRCSCPPRSRR
jgi:hypothetical protein